MPDEFDKDTAYRILNLLCPLTRRDSWWHTEAPLMLLEDFIHDYRLKLMAREIDVKS